MGKQLIARGQVTINSQNDLYQIHQSVGEYIFNASSNGTILKAISFNSVIKVMQGETAITNFTIGTIAKPTGFSSVTVNNTTKTITYSVAANTTNLPDTGIISIPVIISGETYYLSLVWSKIKDGATGNPGQDGITINLSRRSYIISTDKEGKIHTDVTTNTVVSALKGTTAVTPVIGTLPTVPGCTLTKSGTTITFLFKSGTALAENGVIDIPITVDSKNFTVSFSYAKARTGATGDAGADANLLDWVKDWNTNKTVIDSNSIITPKLFAGLKNSNGTISGIAIGKYTLNTLNASGQIISETINGIYGFRDGNKTFFIDNSGNVQLGRDTQYIKFNSVTGKIEFGTSVSLNWINEINNLQSGGVNLAKKSSKIPWNSVTLTDTGFIGKNVGSSGIRFDNSIFLPDKDYYLSFKIKKTEGTLNRIGGHMVTFLSKKVFIDKIEQHHNWHLPLENSLLNDGEWHTVELFFSSKEAITDYLYIQPGRGTYPLVSYEVKEINIREGNIRIAWSPAPDDVNDTITSVGDAAKKHAEDKATIAKNDAINAASIDAIKKINELNIGGRNYLLNSELLHNNDAQWSKNNCTLTVEDSYINLQSTGVSTVPYAYIRNYPYKKLTEDFIKGETYTFSFDAKSNAKQIRAGFRKDPPDQLCYPFINNRGVDQWHRYSHTFKISEHEWTNLLWLFGLNDDVADPKFYIQVKNWKLEKGNKATDWTLAPEDIIGYINEAQEAGTNAQIVADAITKKANDEKWATKLTYIDGTGIFTGTLSANTVNAIRINATQISAGTIDVARLNVAALKTQLITAANIEALTLNVTKGKIGGWSIDADSIFRGTKNNTVNVFTSAAGAITIGSNGIRGFKWRFEATGAGALAGGNIRWDASGNVTFGASVILNWTNAANNALVSAKAYADTKKSEAISAAASDATTKSDAAKELARAMSFGKMLNRVPEFFLNNAIHYNGTNNYVCTNSVRSIEKVEGCPNSTGYSLKYVATNWNQPTDKRMGGPYFATKSRHNAIFIVRIIALIPIGRNINNYHNAYGTGGTTKWLTSQEGTGKWEEYVCKVMCGATGTFSTLNHFALKGGDDPTAETPVTWYIAYATVFDVTSSEKYTTTIDANGIYTGTLTAGQVNAVSIDATSIKTGTLNADRIATGSIKAIKLDAASIKTDIVNAGYINGLACNFTKGTIGGWTIGTDHIITGNLGATGQTPIQIRSVSSGSGHVYGGQFKPLGITLTWHQVNNAGHLVLGQVMANGNTVKTGFFGLQMMAWNSREYFCISANTTKSGGLDIYNRIAGWAFDNDSIYSGTKNNTPAGYTLASGSITIGNNGIRGYKWRLDSTGAGSVAGGNISWDDLGNVTFGASVSLNWTNAINTVVNNLTIGGRNLITFARIGGSIDIGKFNDNRGRYKDISSTKWRIINFTQFDVGYYSVSFWAKANDTGTILFDICDNHSTNLELTTTWKFFKLENLYVSTFLDSPYWGFLDFSKVTSNITHLYLSNLKVEYGSKCTAYTDAPEVLEQALGGTSFPKLTKISSTGIYTGSLTASQVNAVAINASSISTGTLSVDRLAAGSITAAKLNVSDVQSNIVTATIVNGLTCTFVRGKIGGWTIENNALTSTNIVLDSGRRRIAVFGENSSAVVGTRSSLYWNSNTDWGFLATNSSGIGVAKFGSTNYIGGWIVDTDSLYKGTKTNSVGSFTTSYGAMTIGSNGIRGYKWRLDYSGAGALAGGNIAWDSSGNVTFTSAVSLKWTQYADSLMNSFVIGGKNYALETSNVWSSPVTLSNVLNQCIFHYKVLADSWKVGDQINISFDYKYENITRNSDESILIIQGGGNITEWGAGGFNGYAFNDKIDFVKKTGTLRLNYSFIVNSNHIKNEYFNINIRHDYLTGKVYIKSLKIEKGSKPTDWSPAPEDFSSRLTRITATGVYTGSISASQVQIDSTLVVGGLSYNGSISVRDVFNVVKVTLNRSGITAIAGVIGGWTISSNQISKNGIVLGSDGSITNGTKWRLNLDGSGQFADGNITWNTSGSVTMIGTINANSGKIGGFEIGAGRIGTISNPNDINGGGLAIYNHFFRVGSSSSYAMLGDDTFPTISGGVFKTTARITNTRYDSWFTNIGVYIDVKNAKTNYGIYSNATIMGPAMISNKVKVMSFGSGTYNIDFSQHNIFMVYATSTCNVELPDEISVADMFRLGTTLPSDFGCVITFIYNYNWGNRITLLNIRNQNGGTSNIAMEKGDSITLLCAKYPSFHYQIINHMS